MLEARSNLGDTTSSEELKLETTNPGSFEQSEDGSSGDTSPEVRRPWSDCHVHALRVEHLRDSDEELERYHSRPGTAPRATMPFHKLCQFLLQLPLCYVKMGRPPRRDILDQGGKGVANTILLTRAQPRGIENQTLARRTGHLAELIQHPPLCRGYTGSYAGQVPCIWVHHGTGVIEMDYPAHPFAGRLWECTGHKVVLRFARARAAGKKLHFGLVRVEEFVQQGMKLWMYPAHQEAKGMKRSLSGLRYKAPLGVPIPSSPSLRSQNLSAAEAPDSGNVRYVSLQDPEVL